MIWKFNHFINYIFPYWKYYIYKIIFYLNKLKIIIKGSWEAIFRVTDKPDSMKGGV